MQNNNFRPIFHNFNESFVKKSQILRENLGKCRSMHLLEDRRRSSHSKLAILLKKIVQKAMATLYLFENFLKL